MKHLKGEYVCMTWKSEHEMLKGAACKPQVRKLINQMRPFVPRVAIFFIFPLRFSLFHSIIHLMIFYWKI